MHEPQLSREGSLNNCSSVFLKKFLRFFVFFLDFSVLFLIEASQIYTVDTGDGVLAKLSSVGKNHSERSYRIMTGFSKAIWSVLKQYKEKLKVKSLLYAK